MKAWYVVTDRDILWSCGECGAVVTAGTQFLHEDWHRDKAE